MGLPCGTWTSLLPIFIMTSSLESEGAGGIGTKDKKGKVDEKGDSTEKDNEISIMQN